MTNLLKADIYRTRKSTALYAVAVVCILFSLLSALMFRGLDWFASTLNESDIMAGGELEGVGAVLAETFRYENAFAATKEILISDTLIYCLIAIFVIVSGTEFTSATIKNSLMSGIRRKDVYWSKFALSVLYTAIYYFAFWASALLSNMLIYWEGFSWNEFLNLLLIAIKQIPIYIGVIAAGHCFVFMTQSNIGAVALYIVTFMMFNTILPIINIVSPWDFKITLLFPLYQCISLTEPTLPVSEYLIIYGSTIIYTIMFTLAGYKKFNKAEIK